MIMQELAMVAAPTDAEFYAGIAAGALTGAAIAGAIAFIVLC